MGSEPPKPRLEYLENFHWYHLRDRTPNLLLGSRVYYHLSHRCSSLLVYVNFKVYVLFIFRFLCFFVHLYVIWSDYCESDVFCDLESESRLKSFIASSIRVCRHFNGAVHKLRNRIDWHLPPYVTDRNILTKPLLPQSRYVIYGRPLLSEASSVQWPPLDLSSGFRLSCRFFLLVLQDPRLVPVRKDQNCYCPKFQRVG